MSSFQASIRIPRTPQVVWKVLTDVDVWSRWWGGPIRALEPGWETDATVTWARGGTARVTAVVPGARLVLVSESSGTRFLYQLTELGDGSTEFLFEEDYSDARVSVSEPDRKRRRNEETVGRFCDAVIALTPSRRWWEFWKPS